MDVESDTNHVFSEYFCIFCDDSFASIHEAYEHYKCHMNIATFCKVCDKALNRNSCQKTDECDIDHDAENVQLESEQSVIEMWIERLLTYQEELIDKPFYSIITGNKFFLGCPVCDYLIKTCNVKVPADISQKYRNMENASAVDSPPNSSNKESVKCHTARHACAHLRYYPYECYACEKIGRYQKKPDISEMLRHIKDAHGKDVRFRENWESIIKHVTITKVEKFMDYYLKSRPMLRFDPIVTPKTVSPAIVSSEKRTQIEASVVSEQKAKNKGGTTAPSSPDSISSECRSNTSLSNVLGDQKTTETVVYKFNPQNSQKSREGTEKNLQFTITRNRNYLGSNSLESSQSSFQRHFGNIFDDEDMIKFAINQEEDANTVYFCIFCDSTFKDKDEARRHYQKHVNYYPMMCSLCGEGATDMQEFLKHHTEVHPNAEKGRYKRREQPLVDKWINGFLYAQATVIRAFPAREQCPVCEKVFTTEQIKAARPRRCTVNRKIDHVHRHLCYLPYECVKCKEEGKEFVVAYFESKAHSHIKLKHPEIDDTESRWFVFQKTISIPKLDEYVSDFFTKFGISMEFERRPVKKQCRETLSSHDFMTVYSGSSTPLGLGNSLINNSEKFISNSGTMIIISQSQTEKTESFNAKSTDGVVILDDDINDNSSSFVHSEPESLVIALSPSHVDYLKFGENLGEAEYFCIFCSFKCGNKFEAYPHFGEHLEYKPVVCLLCDSRFHDIDEIIVHHQLNHQEKEDLLYEIREDQNVEKWVDEFLDSQQNKLIKETLSCSCASFCPVCERIQSDTCLAQCVFHSDLEVSEHIHRHLLYLTYECALCRKFGRTTRVPNLDLTATNHLKEQHMISDANTLQLSRTFPKTLSIPKLEKLISEGLQRKRSLDRKCNNSRSESESLVMCTVASNGTSDRLLESVSPLPGVAHVRVQGGRVVNLPSSISIRAIHNKQNIDLNKNSFAGDALNNERMVTDVALRFYVKCLHCNVELPSRKQLKMHHQKEHPGLSMACFTTPKSMLSLGSS